MSDQPSGGHTTVPTFDIEAEVLRRYGKGAQEAERGLCCPTKYDSSLLEILPDEILEKDYGCGDPTRYAKPGDIVVDLGSGAGKVCYMLAQKVGAQGRVIGIDFNDEMLAVARKHRDAMAEKLGYANVEFRKGKIQDLQLNLDLAQARLHDAPLHSVEDVQRFDAHCNELRRDQPLVATDSIDLIVSNCVLNLVRPEHKEVLFEEIFRILKRGGRAVISDIVCDEEPTARIMEDPELWSDCISGAFREDEFLRRFEEAGFYGIEILERQEEPWQVVDGIEFRSITVRAYKGKQGICLERNQAVIYKGPWKQVLDDDGHTYLRGQRMAVCDKTYQILTNPEGPYSPYITPVPPYEEFPLDQAELFDCTVDGLRHPRESKGQEYQVTTQVPSKSDCGPSCC